MDPAATQDVQASDNAAVTTQNAADVTTNHAPTLSLADVQAAISKGIAEGTKAIRDDYEARDKKRKELGSILGDDVTLSQAMNEDWSVDRAKLHALERRLPRSPLADLSTSEGAPRKHDVMEAAIMLNAGNSDEDTAALYGEKVVDVALSSGMRGYGLHALCYDVMAAANMPFTPGIFTNQTIRDAFRADRDIILAGQSLYSLTGILSNIANKFLLQGFNSVEQEWRKICAIDSVKDFKEQTFYRLTADAEYAEIGKGEAIPSAEMDEEEFTNSAKTYGKLFAVDRKTLVNDDLNAIRKSLRLHLGRGAGLKMNLIIWGQWVAAANVGSGKFFHTSHSDRGPNYKAGADTALSIESLAVAEKMFLDQVDSNDVPMDVEPTRIVVSTGNKTFADELFLFNTTEGGSTSTKKALTRHPYAGKFQVVCSKYLNKSVFGTDASDVAWYLAADPEALGVGAMQVVFLNGKQTPTIESSDADFDTLGIKMRGYHDFGAKLMEKACVVRMKGEA